MFLVMAVSLVTVRVLLRTLGVEDYGTYNAIAGFVSSLVFVSSALAAASQRYFSFYIGQGNIDLLKKSFTMIFMAYLIVVCILLLFAETIGMWFVFNKMTIPEGRETAVMWVFQMALLTSSCTLLASPYQALIISHEEMNIYAGISIVEVFLKLGIIFLIPIIPIDKLTLYSVLHFFVFAGISCTYYLISCRKYDEARITILWDKGMFRSIFSYSSWSLFGSLAGICNTQGVNILLNIFYGPIANAAYAIITQVSAAVNQFSSSFYSAVRPALIKSYANSDIKYMNKLFYISNKIIFLLMFVLITPIYLVTQPLLTIWLGGIEEYMVPFVRLSLIYTFLLCLSNPITTIIQAANKVKIYHGIVDSLSLFCLPIVYILFKIGLSPIFAYIAIISVFSIAHIVRLFVLKSTICFSIMEAREPSARARLRRGGS